METSESHKQGNACFNSGDIVGADAAYTQAIAEYRSQGDSASKLLAQALGNRSLAKIQLGKVSEALQDAEESLTADQNYVKGYVRKASALEALDRKWEARRVYRLATEHFEQIGVRDPLAFLSKKAKELNAKCQEDDTAKPIESLEHWKEIAAFAPKTNTRMRLATMATFWNDCTQEERLRVLREFMAVVTGNEKLRDSNEVHLQEAQMIELPMENYVDLVIPQTWLEFFSKLSLEDKVVAFHDMYDLCCKEEKHLIIRDLGQFIQLALHGKLGGSEEVPVEQE